MCNLGNPLTKVEYEVNDRIIARIPNLTSNYLGTVIKIRPQGGYTVLYDNQRLLDTEHDQVLGLTYQYKENKPKYIKDGSIEGWLIQRVPIEAIDETRRLLGNPITKNEYGVSDKIVAKLCDGNYSGTVKNGLINGIYSINFDDECLSYPVEHIQILGLTDRSGCEYPIPDNELKDWLRQKKKAIPDEGGEGPKPDLEKENNGSERPKPDLERENNGSERPKEGRMVSGCFSVLASVLKEKALTESLRYLLDSESPHGLADSFLRQLLACANLPDLQLPHGQHVVTASSEWYTDDRRRVDVMVVVRKTWGETPVIVLGVEGKVTAFESQHQLSDYQSAIVKAFHATPKGIILLTPDGHAPETADEQNRACPVSAVSWSQIAEFSLREFANLPFAVEFAEYIRTHVQPSDESVGKKATDFFYEGILPSVRKVLALNGDEITIEWHSPKVMPKEFNFKHSAINTILRNNQFSFYYMFYCPLGVPKVGKQVHLLLMAYKQHGFTKSNKEKLDELTFNYLPPRETGVYEWGPWKFLWSCGCVTLRDMDVYDIKALTALYVGTYRRTATKLKEGINNLKQLKKLKKKVR
ncbi:MAG: PD-(D/E)XK nuclease family protein [Deltaproteobacteria bacterium]